MIFYSICFGGTCLFLLLLLLLLVSDSNKSSPRPMSRLVTNNFFRKRHSKRMVNACTGRHLHGTEASRPVPLDSVFAGLPRLDILSPLGSARPPFPGSCLEALFLRSPPTQPQILGYPLPWPEPSTPTDLGLSPISAFGLLPPGQKPIALCGLFPWPTPRLPPPRARPDEPWAPGAAPPARPATCPFPALVNWPTSLAEARLPQEAH